MEIKNWQAFLAIAQRGSMHAAADAMHLSQPALSKRLSELERRIGLPLFDRIGRDLVINTHGQALLPEAETLIAQHNRMGQLVDQLASGQIGRLRMACSHHIGLHHLPPMLKAFRATHPDIEPELRFLDSEAAFGAVERGDVDIALVTLDPTHPGLQQTPVWHDPLGWYADPSHPVVEDWSRLAQHQAILPEPGTFTRDLVEQTLAGQQIRLTQVLTSNYLETICAMVDAGLGWSVLPKSLAKPHWAGLPGPALSRQLGVVSEPKRRLNASAEAFIALLKNESAKPST